MGRNSRPTKLSAVYGDEPGMLDGECDKPHFEIRIEKSRLARSAGIEILSDLDLDPREFLTKQIKIADHKPALQKIIDKAISETQKAFPNPHVDISKRVRSHYRRMGCETLTGFKRVFPIRAERLKPLNVLNVSNRLDWVPLEGMECGEMSPLSPASRPRIRLTEEDWQI